MVTIEISKQFGTYKTGEVVEVSDSVAAMLIEDGVARRYSNKMMTTEANK